MVPLNPTYNSRGSRKRLPFLGRGHTPYRQRPGNGKQCEPKSLKQASSKIQGKHQKALVIEVRNHTYFKNERSNFDHSDLTLSATKVQFIAGNVKNQYFNWLKITSDKTILNMVKGCIIDFESPPTQTYQPDCKFSVEEHGIVRGEIIKLLDKQVIVPSTHEKDEFVSPIFLRPKKDGSHRMILNLKRMNESVKYNHFKIHTCINLMTPGCYMASIDLSDAYYTIPVHKNYQKYMKFKFENKLYQFTCLANGLTSAPLYFTKILKPVLAHLREQGFTSSNYLDDFFLVSDSFEHCERNVEATIDLLSNLGFYINTKKSINKPTQVLEHLGLMLNSLDMTVSINTDKKEKIRFWATELLDADNIKIRTVAKVVGILVSCSPGVKYAPLYYKQLDTEKGIALKLNIGNFEKQMIISHAVKQDLKWIANAHLDKKPICFGNSDLTLSTDASNLGWGAKCEGQEATGGRWADPDRFKHINYLELKAAFLGLRASCKEKKNSHILLQMDNTTAVAYIRNMGGGAITPLHAIN